MTPSHRSFRTIIACDDIRDEVGNKKSLMGVFSGDIVAASMPAKIQLAFYIEYVTESMEDVVEIFLYVDDEQVMSAKIEVKSTSQSNSATLIIPKGIVRFDKPGILSMKAGVNGGEPTQILHKAINVM